MGSGQTALAALQTNRHFVGYDINPKYVQLAETRIEQYISKNKSPNLFEYLNLPQLT
jgi:site-specific DNA-methyltransferase (adenine-specific)